MMCEVSVSVAWMRHRHCGGCVFLERTQCGWKRDTVSYDYEQGEIKRRRYVNEAWRLSRGYPGSEVLVGEVINHKSVQ